MVWFSSDVKEMIHIDKFFTFFKVHYHNGFNFSGESHYFWECVYVLDGNIWVSGDERVYNLTEGTIIFHKPLELHKFNINNDNGATLLIFSFSLEGKISSDLQNKVFHLSENQKNIISSMLDYINSKLKDYNLMESTPLHQNYLLPFESIPTYSQMLTTYIYQLILSFTEDGSISKVSTTADALIFNKAVNYLNSHICSQPSIPEIAVFCNVSASSLKRIFYKYSGIGVHKYFLKLKIKMASNLLKNGYNVTEVAHKLEFSSQPYFSAVFKRETGICPSNIS